MVYMGTHIHCVYVYDILFDDMLCMHIGFIMIICVYACSMIQRETYAAHYAVMNCTFNISMYIYIYTQASGCADEGFPFSSPKSCCQYCSSFKSVAIIPAGFRMCG